MRLFLAIDVPDAVRAAGERAVQALRLAGTDWRVVRSSAWHVTVRFLGEVDEERVRSLDPVWRAAAAATGALPLKVGGLAAFPDARRPRVLGLRVEDIGGRGAFAALALQVEEVARAQGFAAERRAFSPHVTVARARSPRPRVPEHDAGGSSGEFIARELTLYRSELDPSGARYHVVAAYPLVGGEAA